MNANGDPPRSVPVALLRRYLSATGWQRRVNPARNAISDRSHEGSSTDLVALRSGGRKLFDLFQFKVGDGDEDYIEVVLPSSENSKSSINSDDGIFRTLSQFESRDPQEVMREARSIGFDIVRNIIPNDGFDRESIYLKTATDYLENAKGLLAATANTEMQPDPYFLRIRERAKEYAEMCRFGHTFRGSFGFTIESPLSPNTEPPLFPDAQSLPFERKVIQRLAYGLRQVRDSVIENDINRIIGGVSRGFGANSCDRLGDLLESVGKNEMVFEFSFSREWPAMPQPELLVLGIPHVEATREAAKALRQQPISRSETVVGRVVRLAADDPTELLDDREVAIKWSSEHGETQVRVKLGQDDYLAAVDAHRNGNKVAVIGTLEQKGRRWVLESPSGFSVLPN